MTASAMIWTAGLVTRPQNKQGPRDKAIRRAFNSLPLLSAGVVLNFFSAIRVPGVTKNLRKCANLPCE